MQSYMSSPESPMNLGSPTSASSSAMAAASAANAASPSTHYLPGYLLGDYPAIGHSPMLNSNRSWLGQTQQQQQSPPKALHLPSQFGSPNQNPSSTSGRSPGRIGGGGGGGGMQLLPSPSVVGRKDFKPGAPPTAGLFDHIQTSPPPAAAGPQHHAASASASTSGYTISRLGADSDSFYGGGSADSSIAVGSEGDELWVTVFGFPPAAASYVLQQFSQFGNILRHVIAPNGNWMHLQYQSRIQAQKALSKNGKVYGNMMVGVSECSDQNVASGGSISALHSLNGGSANASFASPPSLLNASSSTAGGFSRTRTMRPLTSSSVLNSSVRDDRDVINDANTPKKSSGLVAKTVDYLFGW